MKKKKKKKDCLNFCSVFQELLLFFSFQALQNANVIIGEIRETHMW